MATQQTPSAPKRRAPLSTLERDGRRHWIHPVVSRGRFLRARRLVGLALVVLFVGLPHLRIGGRPALLIDLGKRQLQLFGTTFFPTETFYLAFIGIGLVLSIALFTALFGRVWCGWACPQPIYLEFVFRPIETLFEGPPGVRTRNQTEPMTAARLARKVGKWAVFAVISVLLANTFVAYFVPTGELWSMIRHSPAENWSAFVAVLVVSLMIFVDYTRVRELTCIIACPYGRLQSVLIDPQSMIVGYDARRGEPRKKVIDRSPDDASGDCVDCSACVRTCPTGIDIREGLQLECIGCTQCIDACDAIMDRVKKPRGLVRYTSLDELEGRKVKWLRPRVFLYLGVVLVAAGVLAFSLMSRSVFEFDVVRQTGTPFYVQSDGKIVNRVRLRVTNRRDDAQDMQVTLVSPTDADLVIGQMPIDVPGHGVVPIEGLVRLPRDRYTSSGGQVAARFRVTSSNGTVQERDFMLLGPVGGGP